MRARQYAARVELVGLVLIETHEPTGFVVRQWREQHGVHHTEHRSCAANAETERENHDRRETGTAPHLPCGVTKILRELIEPDDTVHYVNVLANQRDVAELATGGRL